MYKCYIIIICINVTLYCTFKQRSDVPDVDAASLHELSESDLQEEDRDSSDKDEQQVGDQENTCRRRRVKGQVHVFFRVRVGLTE